MRYCSLWLNLNIKLLQQWDLKYLFKVNIKELRATSMDVFWCLYGWLWTSIPSMGCKHFKVILKNSKTCVRISRLEVSWITAFMKKKLKSMRNRTVMECFFSKLAGLQLAISLKKGICADVSYEILRIYLEKLMWRASVSSCFSLALVLRTLSTISDGAFTIREGITAGHW